VNIELRRLVPLDCSQQVLRERLFAWARLTGFTLSHEGPDGWTFTRGSPWWALISFDVRKTPTTLRILLLPLSASLACSLQCGSWAQIETRGDRPRLEQDLDDLLLFVGATNPAKDHQVALHSPAGKPETDRFVSRPDTFLKP
jgi:hypothetical protein